MIAPKKTLNHPTNSKELIWIHFNYNNYMLKKQAYVMRLIIVIKNTGLQKPYILLWPYILVVMSIFFT